MSHNYRLAFIHQKSTENLLLKSDFQEVSLIRLRTNTTNIIYQIYITNRITFCFLTNRPSILAFICLLKMQIEENDVIIDLIAFDEITFTKKNNDVQVQLARVPTGRPFFRRQSGNSVRQRSRVWAWHTVHRMCTLCVVCICVKCTPCTHAGVRERSDSLESDLVALWCGQPDDRMKLQVSLPLISLSASAASPASVAAYR